MEMRTFVVFSCAVVVFANYFQVCFADDASIEKLVARIERLESQGKWQQDLLNDQHKQLAQQEAINRQQQARLIELHKQLTQQEATNMKQQARLNAQHKQLTQQEAINKQQQARLNAQHKQLTQQEATSMQQQARLNAQHTQLALQETIIERLLQWKERQPKNGPSRQKVTDLKMTNGHDRYDVKNTFHKTTPSRMENQEGKHIETTKTKIREDTEMVRHGRVVMGDGQVAFHAVITKGDSARIGKGQKFVFDGVKLNIGGGYHNQHGVFIAPASGLYIFSVSVLTHNNTLDAAIMKKGALLASTYAENRNGYDQGSVTVVVQVEVGDEIWVEEPFDFSQTVFGESYSSFMGCLIVSF